MMTGKIEKHYKTSEVAKLLSLHPRTVSQYIMDGVLTPVVFISQRDARIPESTIETFLRHRTVKRGPSALE